MKVFFNYDSAQEHPKLGLLVPGENELPESEALTAALKAGLVTALDATKAKRKEKE